MREIQLSVTLFLHHRGKYLFIKRYGNRTVDANRLNGIGGKVKTDEDFLCAAIRETEEEVGLKLTTDSYHYCGILRTVGGYKQDWLVNFFRIEVDSYDLPTGDSCREGDFLWLTPEEFVEMSKEVDVVDDLNYLFPDHISSNSIFFANAKLNAKERITSIDISTLTL